MGKKKRAAMKISQRQLDQIMCCALNGGEEWQLREFGDDIRKIQETLRDHLGLSISAAEAVRFWEGHSRSMDASWLYPGSSEQIAEDFQEWVQRDCDWVFKLDS